MQDFTKYLDVAAINLEVPQVKALKFYERKIAETNIDRVIFQLTAIPDNDDNNTCTFSSFGVINQKPGASGVFIVFQKVHKLMSLFTLKFVTFPKMKLDV